MIQTLWGLKALWPQIKMLNACEFLSEEEIMNVDWGESANAEDGG